MDAKEKTIALQATLLTVNLNNMAENNVFTCPEGMDCYITKVVLRDVSVALDTVEINAGWDTADADDVVANGGALTMASGAYAEFLIKASSVKGTPADVFKFQVKVAEGDPATGNVDIFGYLVVT